MDSKDENNTVVTTEQSPDTEVKTKRRKLSPAKAKKRRRIIAVVIVLALLVSAGTGYGIWHHIDSKIIQVTAQQAQPGTVKSVFETTAAVEASHQSIFTAENGMVPSAVYVQTGDEVKAGQLLAEFDTSSVTASLAEKKTDMDSAYAKYKSSLASRDEAAAALPAISAQIDELEAQKEAAARTEASTAAPTTAVTTSPEETTQGVTSDPTGDVIIQYIGQLFSSDEIMDMISQRLKAGDTIAQINEMISNLNKMSSAASSLTSLVNVDSLSIDAQLLKLKAQQTIDQIESDGTLTSVYKSIYDTKKQTYDSCADTAATYTGGWYAAADGIVSKVALTAGTPFTASSSASSLDLSSILSSVTNESDLLNIVTSLLGQSSSSASGQALVIEDYGEYQAKFAVGKYDYYSLKKDQSATITSASGKTYRGYVSYISATADSSSSSLDIGSVVSSLTGGSTGGSSNSATVIVTILDPDSDLTVGFDATIDITTQQKSGVVTIPIEAVRVDSGERFVYVYHPETKKIEKRTVKIGISEDTQAEITDGLSNGEYVVTTYTGLSSEMTDGLRVKATLTVPEVSTE